MNLCKLSLLSVILLITLSCKKEIEELSLESNTEITNPSPAPIFVVDNFKNVRQLGAKGDGQTDDFAILQSIINNNDSVVFDGGVYIINSTLKLKSGSKILGKNGAIIKAGQNMQRGLIENARYFEVNNCTGVSISGLVFQPSDKLFKLLGRNATILVDNSVDVTIADNTFDFKLPYDVLGYEAVWVAGSKTNNTVIKSNKLYSVGIQYAEDGAKGTVVESNFIKNAHANALTANGNIIAPIRGCKLLNNTIENAGRMGIEDWGVVDGTLIQGNTIVGTGKDAVQAIHAGIGISAVGTNTKVIKNKITDAQNDYIELGGNTNAIADGNEIYDTEKLATGIIFNYSEKMPANVTSNNPQATNNIINGCKKGIQISGINCTNGLISNNTFIDPGTGGIDVDSDAKRYDIQILANKFNVNTPSKKFRALITSYSNLAIGSSNQNLTISKNVINYSESAAGGSALEYSILIPTDNAKILDNEINARNIKSGGSNIVAITGNGSKAVNVVIGNNRISGAIVYLNSYTSPNLFNNSVN